MHGMRWKVNSDTETERGETKGDGLLGVKNERLHLGSGTALSPPQLCLGFCLTQAPDRGQCAAGWQS